MSIQKLLEKKRARLNRVVEGLLQTNFSHYVKSKDRMINA